MGIGEIPASKETDRHQMSCENALGPVHLTCCQLIGPVDASGRQNALVASGCAKEDTTPRVMHDATTFNMITPSMDFERDRS